MTVNVRSSAACASKTRTWSLMIISLFALSYLLIGGNTASATSKIYLKNETAKPLQVESISVTGAALSSKAWSAGAKVIAPGERIVILSIKRTGKYNWMDPTPRFIEPGKTAFFSSKIEFDTNARADVLNLTQKLTGTGSGSKMWYRAEGTEETFDWTLNNAEINGTWIHNNQRYSIYYRAFTESKDSHVEYVVSPVK